MTSSNPLLEAALEYAELGWHVFPLVNKEPLPGSRGHRDATTDPAQIRAWWTAHPSAWIGLHLRASGLIAIDVDPRNGGDALLAQLEREHGALPRALHQRSGGGGEHVLMADPSPGQEGWTRRQEDGGACRGKLGPGVDVKCNGYIVLEPSGQRPDGEGGYSWLSTEVPAPPVPAAWQTLLRKPDPGVDAATAGDWSTSSDPELHPDDAAGLRAALAALPPRQSGKGTTYTAILLVHHDYGLSITEGRSFLEEWNAGCGQPYSPGELTRQVERIARQGRPASERGHRRQALDPFERLARAPGGDAGGWEPPRDPPRADIPPEPEPPPPGTTFLIPAADLVPDIIKRRDMPVVHLPFKRLDEKIHGLELNTVTVIVGGTGKGKTSFAMQLAAHHAQTMPAIVYVGEMKPTMHVSRVLAQRLQVSWVDANRGRLDEAAMTRALRDLRLFMLPRQKTPDAAFQLMRSAVDEALVRWPGEVPLLLVDYVQLLAAPGGGTDMRAATIKAVNDLQQLTEDRPIVSVWLSQGSRASQQKLREGGGNAEDYIGTGAESSAIENAAAYKFDLSYASKDDAVDHDVTLMVSKGRFGGGSKVGFRFNGPTGLWTETEHVPVSDEEQDLRARVLAQVSQHERTLCSCARLGVKKLSMDRLATKGPKVPGDPRHHVEGGRAAVQAAVKGLIAEGLLAKDGTAVILGPRAGGTVES